MTQFLAELAITTFVAVSVGVAFIRWRRSGWFFLLTGVCAMAAGAYWTFSLTEKEVLDLILIAIVDLLRWLGSWRPFLLTGIPLSLLNDAINALSDLIAQAQPPPHLSAVVLISVYFLAKWALYIPWFVVRFAVAKMRRNPYDSPAERHAEINRRVRETAGVRQLMVPLVFAVGLLGYSYVKAHGSGLPPGSLLVPFIAMHGTLFWLGTYVLLLELLGQIVRLDRGATVAEVVTLGSRAERKRQSIRHLYDAILAQHGQHLLYYERPDTKPTPAGAAVAAQKLGPAGVEPPQPMNGRSFVARKIDTLLRGYLPKAEAQVHIQPFVGWVEAFLLHRKSELLINEALHPAHLEIAFALCEHHQAKAQLSLLICPDALVEYVEHWLYRCRSQSFAGLVQRSSSDISRLLVNRTYSYIVVGESSVPQLLSARRESRHLLQNVGFICCLELQDLHVSLLRMQLSRLWLKVERKNVRVMVQAGNLEGARALAENLFQKGPEGTCTFEPAPPLGLGKTSDAYLLVWRNDNAAALSAWRGAVPGIGPVRLSAPLGIAAFGWAHGERTRFAVGNGSIDKTHVEQARSLPSVQSASRVGSSLGIALAVAAEHKIEADQNARVVVAETRSSMLTTVGQYHDRYRDPDHEVLVCVAAHHYPLRDYHAARLRHEGAVGVGAAGVIASGTQVGCQPIGGVYELAKTLQDVLNEPPDLDNGSRQGLGRRVIFDKFVGQLPVELRDQISSTPGKAGLTRLFDTAKLSVKLRLKREEDDTRYFADGASSGADFANRAPNMRSLNQMLPVRDSVGGAVGHVAAADLGLSVLQQGPLLLGGSNYRVLRIEKAAVIVQHDPGDAVQARMAVHPVLRYQWLEGDGSDSLAQDETPNTWITAHSSVKGPLSISSHLGFFRRTTEGLLIHPDDKAPLEDAGALRGSLDGRAAPPVERSYQPVLQLRLSELDKQLGSYDREKLALTLTVVLQDVVRALFPRWSHRLMCVSPAASPVLEANGPLYELNVLHNRLANSGSRAPASHVLAYLYPRLAVSTPAAGTANGTGTTAAQTSGPAAGTVPAVAALPLDIYLIEDSDLDLGVVRSIADIPDRFLNETLSYLTWLTEVAGSVSDYHRLGGAADATELDFKGALMCVRSVWGNQQSTNPAAPPLRIRTWSSQNATSS